MTTVAVLKQQMKQWEDIEEDAFIRNIADVVQIAQSRYLELEEAIEEIEEAASVSFASNMVTIMYEERWVLEIKRPESFVKGTFTP